ncbi:MAG: cysteine desulfurase [Gammaproteobacteria bacterium]|nr:cysteine desulfurase [Gammaproteobacteria bacterium]MCP5138466.1 cysteine desulfurase [Chromatiales bacterium]
MNSKSNSPATAETGRLPPAAGLDVEAIRRDFPILHQQINGYPLAYLDSAASTQRPVQVIDTISRYYTQDHANVHRGVHTLSHRATDIYEGARESVRSFINARSTREIVFTRGTTEAINLVAATLGQRLTAGDEILISEMEHHSNIVPWQMLCERRGTILRVVPINDEGELLFDEYEKLLGKRTRLVAITHVSNALGSVNPVRQVIASAHVRGIPVLIDGAQAIAHQGVDVQALDCDFYAFSGHKMCGPTGIGVLYGREELLETLPPYQGGGDMILTVSFSGTTYNELPYRLEAGTPHIAGAAGLGAAVDYLRQVGMGNIASHEADLLTYASNALSALPGLRLVGTAAHKAGVVSFNVDGIHPHDVGTVLDQHGVAIRAGHHCAMPVMERFGIPGTARASFAFYNTRAEIDQMIDALRLAIRMFA